MKSFYLILLTIFVSTLGLGSSRSDALELLREIRLGDHLEFRRTNNDPSAHPVFSLSFSSDEQRLAVALEAPSPVSGLQSHLLILPIEEGALSKEFDLPRISVTQAFQTVPGLIWSPKGDSLIVFSNPHCARMNVSSRIVSADGTTFLGILSAFSVPPRVRLLPEAIATGFLHLTGTATAEFSGRRTCPGR